MQGRANRGFARRLFVYNYRIGEKHPGAQVASLAVITETKQHVEGRYEMSNWGCSLVFTFPCVQIADYAARWAELETHPNPFAVVVMAQLKALETRGDNKRRFAWKRNLILGLYKRGFDRRRIVALLKFMDWAMRLPKGLEQRIQRTIHKIEEGKKMPYITSWERMAKEEGLLEGRTKGHAEGRAEGRAEGQQEGIQEGVLSSLRLLIAHRFGALSKTVESRLRKLSPEQLQNLMIAQLAFETKADLRAWLQQHATNGSARKQNGKKAGI